VASSYEGATFNCEVTVLMRSSLPYILTSALISSFILCSCGNNALEVSESSSLISETGISSSETTPEVSAPVLESETTETSIAAPGQITVWDTDEADYAHESVQEFLDSDFEALIDTGYSGWWNYNDTMTGSSIYTADTKTAGYSLSLIGEGPEIYYAYYDPNGDFLYGSGCMPREYTDFTSYDLDIECEDDWETGRYYLIVSLDPGFEELVFRASFELQDAGE